MRKGPKKKTFSLELCGWGLLTLAVFSSTATAFCGFLIQSSTAEVGPVRVSVGSVEPNQTIGIDSIGLSVSQSPLLYPEPITYSGSLTAGYEVQPYYVFQASINLHDLAEVPFMETTDLFVSFSYIVSDQQKKTDVFEAMPVERLLIAPANYSYYELEAETAFQYGQSFTFSFPLKDKTRISLYSLSSLDSTVTGEGLVNQKDETGNVFKFNLKFELSEDVDLSLYSLITSVRLAFNLGSAQ